MPIYADKISENKSQSTANGSSTQQGKNEVTSFTDNRPETIAQRQVQDMVNSSQKVKQLKASTQRLTNAQISNQTQTVYVQPASNNINYKTVIQPQWAYEDNQHGQSLNLTKTDDPDIFILKSSGESYKKTGTATDGRPIVTKHVTSDHSDYTPGTFSPYQDWTKGASGIGVPAPFGAGSISAFHNRGAPKTGSTSAGWGGTQMGDTYDEFIRAVTSGTLSDPQIATQLLKLDDTGFTELQKRGASQMHITVYLAEEWRKQGAGKIFRATLRAIENGEIKFNQFTQYFKFVASAAEGRKQVARHRDVQEGTFPASQLPAEDQVIHGNMSPARADDWDTDDEMEDEKALKGGTRDYRSTQKGQKGYKNPWA